MSSSRGLRARGVVAAVVILAVLVAATVASHAEQSEPASSQPVTITTSVEPKYVPIGTPFRFTIRVEGEPGIELFVPLLADHIGDFLISDYGEIEPDGDEADAGEDRRPVVERWYSLISYETGSQFIPGPPVGYRHGGDDASKIEQVEAPKTLINVESELARSDNASVLRDIKGPIAVPPDYTWVAVGAGVLLAALAAGWLLWRRFGASGGGAPVVVRPPHEIALEALNRLRRARLVEDGKHEEYYVRLSAIVRAYLESRFGLRAPEMTTEEFLAAAQRSAQLAGPQRSALGQFLARADLVKFARLIPDAEEAGRAWTAAREFVQATVPASDGGESEVRDAAA